MCTTICSFTFMLDATTLVIPLSYSPFDLAAMMHASKVSLKYLKSKVWSPRVIANTRLSHTESFLTTLGSSRNPAFPFRCLHIEVNQIKSNEIEWVNDIWIHNQEIISINIWNSVCSKKFLTYSTDPRIEKPHVWKLPYWFQRYCTTSSNIPSTEWTTLHISRLYCASTMNCQSSTSVRGGF